MVGFRKEDGKAAVSRFSKGFGYFGMGVNVTDNASDILIDFFRNRLAKKSSNFTLPHLVTDKTKKMYYNLKLVFVLGDK